MSKIIFASIIFICGVAVADGLQQSSKFFICKIKTIPGVTAEKIKEMKIKAHCPSEDIEDVD